MLLKLAEMLLERMVILLELKVTLRGGGNRGLLGTAASSVNFST